MQKIFKYGILLVLFYIAEGCAQPGSPSGGPVDEFPPTVVSAMPENFTTSFDSREIEIEFDEFITLKNPSQNVIITPPLTKDPDFALKGKNLIIEFNTLLDTQTTYVINFGDAIQDLNEGNALKDFKYIFSTGAYLDSLVVTGTLRDAYLNEIPENIRVHLYDYEEGEDSIPALEPPRYFTSVKEDGSFIITNMKPGKYRVFALVDANSNYIYDQPNEVIGFSDPIELNDSADVSLSSFLPTPEIKLTRFRHGGYGVLKAAFNQPIDSISISGAEILNPQTVFSPQKDSVFFYFQPTDIDTLDVIVSSGEFVDTATIQFKSYPKPELRVVQTTITGGIVQPKDSIVFRFNYPLTDLDSSKIQIISDSSTVDYSWNIQERNLILHFDKNYDQTFQISMADSAIMGFNEIYNDSLGFTAKTKKEIDLGAFILNFTPPDSSQYIAQLIDAKGAVKAEKNVSDSGTTRIHWKDLNPEKLTLRAIRDENGDGKWTTGSYWENKQPESVFYFPEAIEIKSNWEIEYNWHENQFNY